MRIGGALLFFGCLAAVGWWYWAPRPPTPIDTENPAEALLAKAKVAIDKNEIERANSLLDELLTHDPTHGLALLYRGQLARDRGDTAAALTDWQQVGNQPPTAAGTARYLEATVWLERGHARLAEKLLLEAMSLHPRYRQAPERLMELYVVQIRRDDARRIIDHMTERLPPHLRSLVFRLVPAWRVTTPDSGAALMRRYLKADPEDDHSRLALARYLLEGEKPNEVIEALQVPIEGGLHNRATALLARASLKIGQVDEARALLVDASPNDAADTELLRARADLAFAESDWETAAALLEQIVAAEPEDSTSLYRLGQARQRLGKSSEAQTALARAAKLDQLQTTAMRLIWGQNDEPELMAPILREVSRLLFDLDYPVESACWLERLLALQPQDQVARAALQETLAKIQSQPELLSRADPFGPNELAPELAEEPILSRSETLVAKASLTPRPAAPSADLSSSGTTIVLTDRHAEAGIEEVYFNGHTGFKHLVESMGGGVGVLDFDGDGRSDLYLPQGSSIPPDETDHTHLDQLYQNLGDGRFRNVTRSAGIVEPRYGQGIACADFNNDGFDDIVVGNYGPNSCFLNNGDGTFTEVGQMNGLSAAEEMTSSLGFGDLDVDGTLDLYVANYVTELKTCSDADGTYHSCSPTNFEARQDRLFRGNGDGTFEDTTQSSGIVVPNGKGLGVLIADFGSDGLPDVYVANDTTPNFLFRNQSADGNIELVEEGLLMGVALSRDGRAQAGMGIACADFDGNGLLDLHTTNFYQETNTLYLNQPAGYFADGTDTAGLSNPSFNTLGFGTQAVDFDLDGWPDLFVANGHIDDFRHRGEPWKMPPQLFVNRGEGKFEDQSQSAGPYFAGAYLGRGVARFDYDSDGRPDLAVVHQDAPLGLLHNETSDAGHSLTLALHGTTSNRSAIGARILITAGGRTQLVSVNGGDGFFSTNDRRQFIGLGDAESVEKLEIRWPSGLTQSFTGLPADVLLRCREGESPLVDALNR